MINKLYICKLYNSGNNIFLGNPSKIKDLINPKNKYIVSDYIKPLLINKRKFDMRIHVVVASYSPLVFYIHKFGYVRFASEDYDKNFNIFVLEVNDNPDLSSQYTPFTEVFDVEHLAKYNILNDLFGNNGLLECKTYPERIRHLYKI